MSGTSLDGISAAAVSISYDSRFSAELLAFRQLPYDVEQQRRLTRALESGTAREYALLDFELGRWLADAAELVLQDAGLTASDVSAVASHGQTVWHEPPGATWQLGQAAVIAERLGVAVVSDFRVADVASGGQGAPLVPIADALLFSHPGGWRALVNIGGIANLSVVPPGGSPERVVAFDTGPGVAVVDGVVQRLQPGLRFDEGGSLALGGTVIETVVEETLEHPFFATAPPKSTGRELFSASFVERFLARCREVQPTAGAGDIVATAAEITARSIALGLRTALQRCGIEGGALADVVVSGGGALNRAIVDRLRALIEPIPLRYFSDVFFDGEAKEAVAFALLGYLHLEGIPGNLPQVTGAVGSRVLGKLTPAPRPPMRARSG
jgi:anhydro-N-acetylmuramic acid kinase